jgi:hypothetical protein
VPAGWTWAAQVQAIGLPESLQVGGIRLKRINH